MASPTSVKIHETCQVKPTFDLPESDTEFSLPLTFLDLFWLRFPPVERLFFFQLTESTPAYFNMAILPKLKHSLSLTLFHFLPLAGRLTWPPQSPKPIILYTPNNGVPLTIAESDADLDHLSSDEIRDAILLRPYIPELPVSGSIASILALQITLFPNKGFTIGYSNNHAVLDGKSSTMFMKSWAYISKHGDPALLPQELVPFYDRKDIKDPLGLEAVCLNHWADLTQSVPRNTPRSLEPLPHIGVETDRVRSTFKLTVQDISKLKNKVLSQSDDNQIFLSTFVVTCAYVLVCMVKARGPSSGDRNRKIWFTFQVDCRARLDPPLPTNYFGNCVAGHDIISPTSDFMEENGLSVIAMRLSSVIKGLEKKGVLQGAEKKLEFSKSSKEDVQGIGVAGSIRFGVYSCDFGWGRPKKAQVTSIDKTGAIALAECRDGSSGVEVGLALTRNEMENFASLFVNGLKDLQL